MAAALAAATPELRLLLRHRLGRLAVGEASIAIVAASPRRDAALGAIRTALERVKSEAPIWKREIYADGGSGWREIEPLAPRAAPPGEESGTA
jgi:molybdopterin synthase catalytic subunit